MEWPSYASDFERKNTCICHSNLNLLSKLFSLPRRNLYVFSCHGDHSKDAVEVDRRTEVLAQCIFVNERLIAVFAKAVARRSLVLLKMILRTEILITVAAKLAMKS